MSISSPASIRSFLTFQNACSSISACLQSAVAEAANQVEQQIKSDVGGVTLPLAKMVPKVTAAGNRLLDARSPDGLQWLRSVSELGKVNELCASVYSCGPPP